MAYAYVSGTLGFWGKLFVDRVGSDAQTVMPSWAHFVNFFSGLPALEAENLRAFELVFFSFFAAFFLLFRRPENDLQSNFGRTGARLPILAFPIGKGEKKKKKEEKKKKKRRKKGEKK